MDLVEVKNRKSEIENRHPWELARLEVVNSLLKNIIKNRKNFNVLDIGCGDIFLISKLSDLYPEVNFYAIDIAFDNDIILKLKEDVGSRKIFLFKSLEEANAHLKGQADLVLLLDVIEHIQDDISFLNSLNSSPGINIDTQILITVPAYQFMFCSHDHFLGHYRRYTNKNLEETIRKTGFKKTEIGYFFTSLIPPRIIQVFKEKLMKPDLSNKTTGLVEWNKGKFITQSMKNVLLFDFKITNTIKKLFGINLPGLSNYIVCKKQA